MGGKMGRRDLRWREAKGSRYKVQRGGGCGYFETYVVATHTMYFET